MAISVAVTCCYLPFLLALFSVVASFLSFSLLFVPCLTRRRQVARSSAQASHVFVSMWHVFMSLLQTSLKRRRGLPTSRMPSNNLPYSRSLGMRPLSILLTWPSQRRRLSQMMAGMQFTFDHSSTSVLGTLS